MVVVGVVVVVVVVVVAVEVIIILVNGRYQFIIFQTILEVDHIHILDCYVHTTCADRDMGYKRMYIIHTLYSMPRIPQQGIEKIR